MRNKQQQWGIHVFGAQFFGVLWENDPASEIVKKWTHKTRHRDKVEVFRHQLLLIPIHIGIHWSFCVVMNPGCVIESGNNTCVVHLDPMGSHNTKLVGERIKDWLNAEWKRSFDTGACNDAKRPFSKIRTIKAHGKNLKCYLLLLFYLTALTNELDLTYIKMKSHDRKMDTTVVSMSASMRILCC